MVVQQKQVVSDQMKHGRTITDEAWLFITSFLKCPSVAKLICASTWWYQHAPEHVRHLSLRPIECDDRDNHSYDPSRMMVQDHFLPRAYLRRFSRLSILEIEIWDEDASYAGPRLTMYYLTVAGALGSLLETGAFPELNSLLITTGGYHTGELVHARDIKRDKAGRSPRPMENPKSEFWFYTWVHQLAISIVGAVRSGAAPNLRNVCINDNFGCAYFGPRPCEWRRPADPQTKSIRSELSQITEKREK